MATTEQAANLRQKLAHLPTSSGVYLMKDQTGKIIYVGKAKNIRNRVRSYFMTNKAAELKTRKLVDQIADIEIILTHNEVEALLTERTLIRHHSPRYNVVFRDDKEYPYVRVDMSEEWPRIEKVRRRKNDGATYLGPYGKAGQLNTLLKAIHRIFPLIKCSRYEFKQAKRPCNYFHMNLCLAPCSKPVSRDDYLDMIESALALLQGKNAELTSRLEGAMQRAAANENFESAAQYRDQLQAVKELNLRQSVVVQDIGEADVINFVADDDRMSLHVLSIRSGTLHTSENFLIDLGVATGEEALRSFILQHYDHHDVPDEIVVPFLPDEHEELIALFATFRDDSHSKKPRMRFSTGKTGSRKDLLSLAHENARYGLDEASRQLRRLTTELNVVKEKLALPKVPTRMECMDISNLQGTAITASCVCFIDGVPAKHEYRTFSIRTVTGQADDYASMREVVARRIAVGRKEDNLPDLLVIDGGRGQLKAASDAAQASGCTTLAIVALAKSRTKKHPRQHRAQDRTFERVFIPNQEEPVILPPGSPEYRLLTHIRDEAHRFALFHHRKRRGKQAISSELDTIPGVGPTIKKRLIEHFGNIEGIRNASLEALLSLKGLPERTAVAIHSKFQDSDEHDGQ